MFFTQEGQWIFWCYQNTSSSPCWKGEFALIHLVLWPKNMGMMLLNNFYFKDIIIFTNNSIYAINFFL